MFTSLDCSLIGVHALSVQQAEIRLCVRLRFVPYTYRWSPTETAEFYKYVQQYDSSFSLIEEVAKVSLSSDRVDVNILRLSNVSISFRPS